MSDDRDIVLEDEEDREIIEICRGVGKALRESANKRNKFGQTYSEFAKEFDANHLSQYPHQQENTTANLT